MNNDIYVNYLIFCSFSVYFIVILNWCTYTCTLAGKHARQYTGTDGCTHLFSSKYMSFYFWRMKRTSLFVVHEGGWLFIKHGCLNIRLFYVFVTRDNLCFTQSSFLKLCLNLNWRYLHTILEKKAYTFNISIFTSFVNVNVHDFLSFLIIG